MVLENRHFIDCLILCTIMLQLFILNFLGLSKLANWALLFMIIFRLLLFWRGRVKIPKEDIMYFLLVFLVYLAFSISALLGDYISFASLRRNFNSFTYPLLIATYVAFLVKYKRSFLTSFFNKGFTIFNLYFLINCILLLFQIRNPGLLAGVADWTNDYKPDLISGLFGYCGTHQLGLYSCFILVYNLYYAFYVSKKRMRNALILYNTFLFAYTIIISSKNDNKMFYILSAYLMFMFYMFNKYTPHNRSKRIKSFGGLIICCITIFALCFVAYLEVGIFKEILDRSVLSIIHHLINIAKQKNRLIVGGSERLYMIVFAFTKYNGWLWGNGIGTYYWLMSTALGFTQFGQSDLGNFLCLGGLFFTIPCLLCYGKLYTYIARVDIGNRSFYLALMIFVFYIIMTIYTLPMKSTPIQIAVIMIYVVYGLVMETKENR